MIETSSVENKFYVYAHYDDSGKVFYVGKGHGKRSHSLRRSLYWKRYATKHGLHVKIWAENLTEEQAFTMEKDWIKVYGRRDLGTGCLVNLTDGGEGGRGKIISAKTRALVSKANKGSIAISNSSKAYWADPEHRKMRIEKLRKGHNESGYNHGKPVFCPQTARVYSSCCAAANTLNVNAANVSAIATGKCRQVKGYFFTYDIPNPLPIEQEPLLTAKTTSKLIYCRENKTLYFSVRHAADSLNLDAKGVSAVALGKTKALKGYSFTYNIPEELKTNDGN